MQLAGRMIGCSTRIDVANQFALPRRPLLDALSRFYACCAESVQVELGCAYHADLTSFTAANPDAAPIATAARSDAATGTLAASSAIPTITATGEQIIIATAYLTPPSRLPGRARRRGLPRSSRPSRWRSGWPLSVHRTPWHRTGRARLVGLVGRGLGRAQFAFRLVSAPNLGPAN